MAEPTFASRLQPYFSNNLFLIDPSNPERTESGIVQFLMQANLQQNTKTALIALGTIALGLLLFAPQD
jgi:hypothetical protein